MDSILKTLDSALIHSGSYTGISEFLKFSAIAFNGVFTNSMYPNNRTESQYFSKFRRRAENKGHIIPVSPYEGIFRLTSLYLYANDMEDIKLRDLSKIELTKSMLMGYFLMEHKTIKKLPLNKSFSFKGKRYVIDNFESITGERKKQIVITTPNRTSLLSFQDQTFFVPKKLIARTNSIRDTRVLEEIAMTYFREKGEFPDSRFYKRFNNKRLLDNWVWKITNSSPLHLDKRVYPFFGEDQPLTGEEKYKQDIYYLNNPEEKIHAEYRFGIYPKD